MASKLNSLITRDYTSVATLLFFGVITILYTFPVLEGDFFWHVKTGQWIWEHTNLPSTDPFSHINSFIEPTEHAIARTRFLLTQYWLGQLAFFGIWSTFGEAGMVVLRALLYTGILGFLYWWLKREKNGIIALTTVFVIGNELRAYPGERPQIFAFFFMALMLYLLEQIFKRSDTRKKHAMLLLIVMLAWSNCHGSFILGIVVIVLYAACHILTTLKNRVSPDRPLLTILSGSVLISLINPNGFAAFYALIDTKSSYKTSISENVSPLSELLSQHVVRDFYWAALVAVFIIIVTRYRSMTLPQIVILLLLSALSLTGLRYIPFFLLAVPLAAMHLPDWKPRGMYGVMPLLLVLLWSNNADYKNALQFRANKAFPVEAVKFINTVKPSGNIFNYTYWGGYLMCYTNYPVFADGRGLVENFTVIHNQTLSGINWQGPLSYFNINTIIIPGTQEGSRHIFPLISQLDKDNSWSLIYQDDVALVFLRNIPQNRELLERYTISKDRITTHITKRLEWQTRNEM